MLAKQVSPPSGGMVTACRMVASEGSGRNDLSVCHLVEPTLPLGLPSGPRFDTTCSSGSPLLRLPAMCRPSVPNCVVWHALRDYGAVHRRVAAGFVTDCRLDGEARIVNFANGLVAREVLVDLDDAGRRLAYSVTQTTLTHHNASFEVIAEGEDRCRV